MYSNGGDGGIRTPDLYSAIVALSQLSYVPMGVWDYTQAPIQASNRTGPDGEVA